MANENVATNRSTQRFELARLSVVFGSLERGIGTALALLRVPLLIWALSLYQYGLYMAILGVVATAHLLDFGLHYGVVNAVAEARGRDDLSAVGRIIATAFVIYSLIASAVALLILPAFALLPMGWLLNVPPDQETLARNVALLGYAGVVLPLPLKVFSAGMQGFQKQYVISAFRSAWHILIFGVLAAAVALFPENLIIVVAVGTAGELLYWLAVALVAVRRQPELTLRFKKASRSLAPSLTAVGLAFFVTNIANLFKFTLGNTVVSHGLGPGAVPSLAVPLALYMAAHGIASMGNESLWPAYGEAATRGEWEWVQRAFCLGAKVALGLSGAFAVLGGLLGGALIEVWTPKEISVSEPMLLLLSAWLLSQMCFNVAASLLAALKRVSVMMYFSLFEGIGVFGLSLWWVEPLGAEGVALAMLVMSLTSASLCLGVAVPRATGRRVRTPWGILARVALCIGLALGVGVAAGDFIDGDTPLLVVIRGGVLVGGTYAGAAWWILMDHNERRRVGAWCRRQLDFGR